MIFKISVISVTFGSLVVRHNVFIKTIKTNTTIFLEPPTILSQIRINDGLAKTAEKHEPYHESNGNAPINLFVDKCLEKS